MSERKEREPHRETDKTPERERELEKITMPRIESMPIIGSTLHMTFQDKEPEDRFKIIRPHDEYKENRNAGIMALDGFATLVVAAFMMFLGGASIVGILGVGVVLPFALGRLQNAAQRLKINIGDTWRDWASVTAAGLAAGFIFGMSLPLAPLALSVVGWLGVSLASYYAGRISPNFYKNL